MARTSTPKSLTILFWRKLAREGMLPGLAIFPLEESLGLGIP
jgi:hypothetical protein